MPKNRVSSTPLMANLSTPNHKNLYKRMQMLFDDSSDSETETLPTSNEVGEVAQVGGVSDVTGDVSGILPADEIESEVDVSPQIPMREWNQKGIPKTLPYNRATYAKWNRAQKYEKEEWVSITKINDTLSITPPHELATKSDTESSSITYTNTIDCATHWSDKIVDAFEKVSTQSNSGLSEDFKQSLGKLSFFRKPLITKQKTSTAAIDS